MRGLPKEETIQRIIDVSSDYKDMSATAIAKKIHKDLGLDQHYVMNIVSKYHKQLTPKKMTKETKDEILKKFHALDDSLEPIEKYRMLAKEYKCTHITIYKIATGYIPPRKREDKTGLFDHTIFPF